MGSGLFERVCVTTEDDGIAAVSTRHGASVISRRREMAGDDVPLIPVVLDFIENEEHEGRTYDELCVLMATAPMRNAQDIRDVMALLKPGTCEFSMAVTEYGLSPHQALIADNNGTLRAAWPELVNKQEQDVPKYLCDNGSTYGFIVDGLKREKTFYGKTLKGHVMPRRRSVDLNEPEDMEILELFAGSSNS